MEEFDKLQEGLDSGGGKQTSTCQLGGQDPAPEIQVGRGHRVRLPLQLRIWGC